MKAFLVHPTKSAMGNLRWPHRLPAEHEVLLRKGLNGLRARGYWVSAFPERDGVAFNKTPYDPMGAIEDFRRELPFIDLERGELGQLSRWLANAVAHDMVRCTY